MLSIQAESRTTDGKAVFRTTYNRYVKLYENSSVLSKKVVDTLRPIQINGSDKDSDTSSKNKV